MGRWLGVLGIFEVEERKPSPKGPPKLDFEKMQKVDVTKFS